MPTVLPVFTNWLQVVGFCAILLYMAYLRRVGSEEARTIKDNLFKAESVTIRKIEAANSKADSLHDLWNSRLDEFRKMLEQKSTEAMAANKAEFDRLLIEAQTTASTATLELRQEFAERIKGLERTIASQQKTIEGPKIENAEQRLGEIRGEPK